MAEKMEQAKHGSSMKKRHKRSSSIQSIQTEESTSERSLPDLISALPDSLIVHILSLLNMDQVMKTTLLSRRWRYSWKSIPCLCFEPLQRFYFIDRCLFHHEGSKIRKLHISFNYKDSHDFLADSWIHFAIRREVEDFKLNIFGGDFQDKLYKLPRTLYFCRSLTSLELCGCNLNLPDSFQLGSLKKLSLQHIKLISDSIEHFSSSCPLLEDMYLTYCNRDRDLNIVITNEHVKRLEISYYGEGGCYTVHINAPTLLSLVISDCWPGTRFDVKELGSLVRADIIGKEAFSEYLSVYYLTGLLHDLRHVKHLKLCGWCIQVLSARCVNLNGHSILATCLELQASLNTWELGGIFYLLQSCLNLEILKIDLCDEIQFVHEFVDSYNDYEDYWDSNESDLPSTMQKINTIEINDLSVRRHEDFVRILLENADALERMVITTPKGYANNFELLFKLTQKLLAFPRSSPNAKLFIT